MTKPALTFEEIQRKMQMGKRAKQGVSFNFRHVEDISTYFKSLASGWTLIYKDNLTEMAGRVFIEATATIVNNYDKAETYTATAYAELDHVPLTNKGKQQMNVAQWTGAVSSYARKYAVQGLFAMGEADVDSYITEQEQQADTLSADQLKELRTRISYITGVNGTPSEKVEGALLAKLGAQSLEDVLAVNYEWSTQFLDMLLTRALDQSKEQAQQAQQPNNVQEDTAGPAGQGPQDFDINQI